MKYPKHAKRKLFTSFMCILLCISMLLGSTFAWFTDRVSTKNNIITSGNLDLEMYWTDDPSTGVWNNVEEEAYNTIFSYDNWEPGYTDVKYIKIVNKGELALNYDLSIEAQGAVGKLAEVINVYYAINDDKLNLRSDLDQLGCIGLLSNVMNGGSQASGTLLPAGETSLFHNSGEVIVTLAMQMVTTAGNEYQNESSGEFTIKALATQAPWERDSFGSDYDSTAEMPVVLVPTNITVPVVPTAENTVDAEGLEIVGPNAAAYLPEGVKLDPGVTELTFSITPKDSSTSGLSAVNDESILPMDVHIEGVAEDNDVPIIIDLGVVLPKYLNMGNYYLVHVEDGTTNVMTQVSSRDQLQNHNEFTYDSNTGAVSVAMASFSAVEAIANNANVWKGGVDYSWFVKWGPTDNNSYPNRRIYTLTNADQLYGFAKIVGGMHVQDKEWLELKDEGKLADNVFTDGGGVDILGMGFNGHTVQLLNDVDLGGTEVKDVSDKKVVFYPIGYYNSTRDGANNEDNPVNIVYDRSDGDVTTLNVTSSFAAFRGTFNGNGHTIKNLYQNTWEMFGDYNSGYSGNPNYYKDGMGLFGWMYGATVYNTNIDNFQSDGEFTPTGIIAAYAEAAHDKDNGDYGVNTIQGVSITNSNPRVYNTGNGGIVGLGGRTDTPDAFGACDSCELIFKNITVDQTNKISALWGSWDVGCGGIMGMYRGYGKVTFDNCHVAAQIDVYNDVCGNYQYYWYRYAGMMIGTIYNDKVDENGYTVPDTTGINATNCTVRFDEWNDYYYCELVANSLASYTHDHQMSRLEEVKAVNGTQITYLDGTTKAVPASGRYNYVVTEPGKRSTEKATCYHFVDGAVWNHEDAGTETVNGVAGVLKEDKQHIYLPFNQLFQGYGWGVKHIPIYDESDFPGITIQTREDFAQEKFTANFVTSSTAPLKVGAGATIKVGDLFTAIDPDNVLDTTAVFLEEIQADGTYKRIPVDGGLNWHNSEITVGTTDGMIYQISIQDFNYCLPTVMYLQVVATTKTATCEHCGTEQTWTPWYPGALATGHYYLVQDVTVSNPVTVATGAVAALDLNGHTLNAPNSAAVDVGENQTLSIVDSGTTGEITGLGDEDGLLKVYGGTLNLYDGSYSYVADGGDTTKGIIWAANLIKDEGAKEIQTKVLFSENVTAKGQVFLTAGAKMEVVGQFDTDNVDTDNVAKVVLESSAIMIIENMTAPESGKEITVNAIDAFAKMNTSAGETDPMQTRKTWFKPAQGEIIASGERELWIEVDISNQIRDAFKKGADIAAIQQNVSEMQKWIDDDKCPMCGLSNVKWTEYNRDIHALSAGNETHHIYFKNGTTYGTKDAPIEGGNFIGSYRGTKKNCVMVMNTDVYTKGRFLINPNNTLNIMGKGNLHSEGSSGLGMFTVLGKNATVNLYGCNYTYDGNYYRNDTEEEPVYALIYTSSKGCTVNIYNDVKIGYNTTQQSPNYNAYISGTLNMYGGTIQNGVSNYQGFGGNVTLSESGILNMYDGTITGGSTNYRGGNVMMRSYTTLNMGYRDTVLDAAGNAINMDPQIIGGTALYEQNVYTTAGLERFVPGGGNIGTGEFVGYINFNMYSGGITGGKVDVNDATANKEFMGGGNIYMNGAANNKMKVSGGAISNGVAHVGGNIYIRNGIQCIIGQGATVSNGNATLYGGNIHVFHRANLIVNGANILGGSAVVGGNISVGQGSTNEEAPTATITNATISGGEATTYGGNIFAKNSNVTITGGAISGGTAIYGGGNIHLGENAQATVSGSAAIQNGKAITADKEHGQGGNINVGGGASLTVSGGTISGGYSRLGGNIAVGEHEGAQATLNITGGVIKDGYATINGGNLALLYSTDATISAGQIYGGTLGANYGKNIYVGQVDSSQTAPKLTISGGNISGDVYVGYNTTYNVSSNVILSGNPIIKKNSAENGTGVEGTNGLLIATNAKIDISGLTTGAKIDLQMATAGVFTNKIGSITAATARTYFTVLNSNYEIVADDDQLALAVKSAS